jgi:hypothetical protein
MTAPSVPPYPPGARFSASQINSLTTDTIATAVSLDRHDGNAYLSPVNIGKIELLNLERKWPDYLSSSPPIPASS